MSDAWNPAQYEKFKNERSQPFFDLMKMIRPVPGAKVIDLGCGTGELTAKLHQHLQARETLGLDSSEQMLSKAQAMSTESLKFNKGNIDTWEAKAEFDVIFSNAALHWCPHHPLLFQHLRQALRNSGQLAIQMPMNHEHPTQVVALQMSSEKAWSSLLGESYGKQQNVMTAEQYANLLFHLGFAQQEVLCRVYGHRLESRQGVIDWVKGSLLTFFESRLSKSDYQRFLAEFTERVFAELPDEKPFFFPFKRIFLWARL